MQQRRGDKTDRLLASDIRVRYSVQPKPVRMPAAALAAELMAMPRQQARLLVGVDGAGGAGLSTCTGSLNAAFAPLADDTRTRT